jgi:hypothetical protein
MPEPTMPPEKPKPGYRTTEFYFSIAAALVPQVIDHLPPTWRAGILAAAGLVYTLSRGLAKLAQVGPPPPAR